MCSVTASDEPTKDISEQHHDNDPLSIEVTLKVDSSSTGGSGGNKKNKRKFKFDIFPRADLIECVRTRDYDLALRIFAQVKEQNRLSATFLYSLLSVCYKAEHLESAQLFFNEILNQGQSPTEQAYLALIRCYSDANRFEESLSLVKSMQELNIEVRHRTFQPILDAFLRNNDLENILNIMFKMIFLGIHPRSEQVTALLKCCALVDASPFQDAVNAIMMESSKDLIGLDYQNILELKLAFEDISNQTLEVEGILVDSIESIPGSVLEKTESYVIAQNNTFNISASLESFEDARVSLKTVSDIEANLDTYDIIDTSSSRVSNEVVSDFTSSFFKADMPTFVEDRYTVRSTNFTSRRANIVDISSSSCMCPNCGARIQTIKLSEDTKEAARVALMRVASAASISHCKNLQVPIASPRIHYCLYKYVLIKEIVCRTFPFGWRNVKNTSTSLMEQMSLIIDKISVKDVSPIDR
jgi:pentatricopeptide repeat protein